MSLLASLLASVRREYWADDTKAGVVLSDLGTLAPTVYASICRYPTGPNSKQVVCKVKADDVDKALRALSIEWLIHTRRFEALRAKLDCPKPFDAALERAL